MSSKSHAPVAHGTEIISGNPLEDMGTLLLSSMVFYSIKNKRQKTKATSPCLSDWIAIDVEKNTHISFYCYGMKAAYASLSRRFIAHGSFGYYD